MKCSGGHVLAWDNFDCMRGKKKMGSNGYVMRESFTQPPPSTHPTHPTFPSSGCFHKGRYYDEGETIMKKYDQESNWCYGLYCKDGNVLPWDTPNCRL